MGRYLAIEVSLDQPSFPEAMFRALTSSEYFHLTSIAAIDGHESGDDWFLSGYTVEDFVARFAPRASSPVASIDLIAAEDGANAHYLERAAQAVRGGEPMPMLSPFEEIRIDVSLTLAQKRNLGQEEIRSAALWFRGHPNAVFHIYGGFSLLLKQEAQHPAQSDFAFREVGDLPEEIAFPLVLVRAGRDPITKTSMNVTLMSWSTVWLKDADNSMNLIGKDEAGENLRRLATLVETIVDAERGRLISVSLSVDGKQFAAHEQELRKAFRDVQSAG